MENFTSLIRLRISAHDAHYAGGLVDGAKMLHLRKQLAEEPGKPVAFLDTLRQNRRILGRRAAGEGIAVGQSVLHKNCFL